MRLTAHDALKLLLSGNGKASEALTQTMTPAGQEIMQHIYHKQRESLAPAILAEIDKRRDELAAASPAGHLRFLHVPVLLLHGSDDTDHPADRVVVARARHPAGVSGQCACISPAISHVEVGSKVSLRGRLALVHWMAMMIREARNTAGGPGPKLPAGEWIVPATAGWSDGRWFLGGRAGL